MSSINIAAVIFLAALGGALAGLLLRRLLPERHLHAESKEVIRLGTGLIATMAALVLGLLVGSAKSSFDAQQGGFDELALNFIMLDRTLAHYGPDANDARIQLRKTLEHSINSLWPSDGSAGGGIADSKISDNGRSLFADLRALSPQDESQRWLKSEILRDAAALARDRWQLAQQSESSLPMPFLLVLAFWLSVLFLSFGLFAPHNATVFIMLLICAMSVAGAVFLIVDLDQPLNGFLTVSSGSMRDALEQLGK